MPIAIPAPAARFQVAMEDGVNVAVRRYGKPTGTRLLISHGNGFAIDAYQPFWAPLMAEHDVVIFDFRNHGQSDRSPVASHTYARLARDLERVIAGVDAELGRKPTVGVMHSFSARTAMKHAIEIGWRWSGLVLFDPPNVPPPSHPIYPMMEAFEERLVKYASARRRTYGSVDELTQEYLASRATERWMPGVHDLMARSVLRRDDPREDGGAETFSLVCAPEVEASIYAEALKLNLWPNAKDFGGPTMLVGCDADMKGAPATGAANRALGSEGGYDYKTVAMTSHLMQIENAAACVEHLAGFLTKHGLLRG